MTKAAILKNFSCSLKKFWKNSGQTQQQFIESCDITTVNTLQNYLKGKNFPPIKKILQICCALQISPNDLFADTIDYSNECESLKLINGLLVASPDSQCGRMFKVLQPVLDCMINGSLSLQTARFGARIKILRTDSHISQKNFASLCKISSSTLRSHESEQRYPSPDIFINYCRIFKVSPEYLLYNDLTVKPSINKNLYALNPRQISAIAASIQQGNLYLP